VDLNLSKKDYCFFSEWVVFNNPAGNSLVGLIDRADEGDTKYIILVHGFAGSKDEKGLFIQATSHFINKGFSVFRFDLRGCGDSDGDFAEAGLEEQKEDLLAAISFLKKKESLTNDDIYLVGFSLGATISLLGYEEISDIKGLAFWSPALFPDRDMYPRYQVDEIISEINTKGYFEKSGLKVGKKIIDNLKNCHLIDSLVSIKQPVLLIHGKKDDKISVKSTEIAAKLLNGNSILRTFPGSDHSFRSPQNARSKLFNETANFFKSIEV
jgi:pimeloyl-ACP methyl ester carboxylesterase